MNVMNLGSFRQRLTASLITAVIACGLGAAGHASADVTFTVTDTVTSYPSPNRTAQINGDEMLWTGDDQWGRTQVFYQNLASGEAKQLTSSDGEKDSLSLGGDYFVIIHYKETHSRDVELYNIKSGEMTKLNASDGSYENCTTDGRYVAYHSNNKDDNKIYVYDIEKKTTKPVAEGDFPVLVDGKIVFRWKDGLAVYDIVKDELRPVMDALSDGYVDTLSGLAFNGHTIAWIHDLFNGGVQTRMLQLDVPDARIKIMSSSPNPKRSIVPIVTGDHVAAWVQSVDGTEQIVAGDLATGKSYVLTHADSGHLPLLVGIYRDQVVLKGDDGNLIYKAIHVSGDADPVEEVIPLSAVPKIDWSTAPNAEKASTNKADELATPDGSAKLSVPDYANFHGLEDLSLSVQREHDLDLTKALAKGQRMLSFPWDVEFPTPETQLNLYLRFDSSKLQESERNKVGIYRLEGNSWAYVGGLYPVGKTDQLYTNIIKPGVYAVLLMDVPNEYVRDYWIQKRLADYNADLPIRVFLNGEEVQFDEPPRLQDGSTTVQFRPIFEKLGLSVDWDGATQTISGSKEGKSLKLTLGQLEAQVDGTSHELPVSPYLYHDNTFVPLRFVGEATGLKVVWDPNLKAVWLYDPTTEGKLYYPDGTLMYEGQVRDGKMNGKGKLYRENGKLWYDAQFVDNEVKGWGSLYFDGFMYGRDRTGESAIGQFAGGLPQGYIRYFDDSGYLQYVGYVDKGLFEGKGKYYEAGQLIYEGDFKNNLYDGYGKYYVGGKIYYEGGFEKNLEQGKGKKYDENGKVEYETEFKDGAPAQGIW